MKNQIAFIILSLTTLFFFNGICLGNDKPQQVVIKYCELEYDGYGLSGKTFNENIMPLLSWDDDYPGIGWDTVEVIENFEIIKADINETVATIRVKYNILGEWGEKFVKNHQYKHIDFHLVISPTGWKITDDFCPKISIDAAIKHQEKLLQRLEGLSDKDGNLQKTIAEKKSSIAELKQLQNEISGKLQ